MSMQIKPGTQVKLKLNKMWNRGENKTPEDNPKKNGWEPFLVDPKKMENGSEGVEEILNMEKYVIQQHVRY